MAWISRDTSGQLWQVTANTDGSLTTTAITSDLSFNPSLSRDATGQLWEISVNLDGSLFTTPVSDAPPVASADGCTVTLQSVVDLCRTHNDLMPLANVGGFSQEPALSLANDTLQELAAAPYDWKFNTNSVGVLATQPSRQDYLYAGASAFVLGVAGASIALADGSAITQDVSKNVTVLCLQPHNFTVGQTVFMVGNTVAAYNSVYVQTPTSSNWSNGWVITAIPDALTFQFAHTVGSLGASGAPGINDYSWLEHSTMYDLSSTDPMPYQWEVSAVKTLKRSSQYGRPKKICVLSQSSGILSVRLTDVPQSPTWGITLNYQKRVPLKTDLTQTWAPFPDEYGFVYRQMFLARCYRFLKSATALPERQLAEAMITKALGKDDVEESDQYVTPERTLMGDWY